MVWHVRPEEFPIWLQFCQLVRRLMVLMWQICASAYFYGFTVFDAVFHSSPTSSLQQTGEQHKEMRRAHQPPRRPPHAYLFPVWNTFISVVLSLCDSLNRQFHSEIFGVWDLNVIYLFVSNFRVKSMGLWKTVKIITRCITDVSLRKSFYCLVELRFPPSLCRLEPFRGMRKFWNSDKLQFDPSRNSTCSVQMWLLRP